MPTPITQLIEIRHCAKEECPYHNQGKQVPCRLYELDLLHGREKLTPEEVERGKTPQGAPCRYQLPDDTDPI
jgi:hypothetical protein